MALSTQRAVSDGTMVRLDLSVEYFERTEIEVFFGGNLTPEGSGWSWIGTTDKAISFSPAVAAGTEVMVKRSTAMEEPRHSYTGGAQFLAETMDENFIQMLRIAQEAKEGSTLSEIFNDLNMHGFQIQNLGPATQDNHPVSLGVYKADAQGANQAKLAAQSAQAASEGARDRAVTAENASKASEDAAAGFATTAGQHKTAAETARSGAEAAKSGADSAKAGADASLKDFKQRYQGSAVSDPATRYDGTALQLGDLYFNTTTNAMQVYGSNGWKAAGSAVNGMTRVQRYTPTAGQTVFTVADGYDPGFAQVFVNGWKMVDGVDVTATTGVDFTLTEGVTTSDVVEVVCYGAFVVANTYTKTEVDSKDAAVRSRTEGPCFSVYANTNATGVTGGAAKVALTSEEFDVGGCFDASTYRFKPASPGYYQLSANLQFNQTGGVVTANLYKNSAHYKSGSTTDQNRSHVSGLVYLNGTTDYVELWVTFTSASGDVIGLQGQTYMTGYLARAA